MPTLDHTHRESWRFTVSRNAGDEWPDSRPVPFSRIDRHYRPEAMTVLYETQGYGAPISLRSFDIHGHRILKGGTLGGPTTETVYRWSIDAGTERWIDDILTRVRGEIEARRVYPSASTNN